MYISLRLTPARLLMLVTAVLCAVLICDAAATLKAADSRITLASDFERAAYLESLGCPVESEPASVRQLTISSSPDETMSAYLSVLEKQGYLPRAELRLGLCAAADVRRRAGRCRQVRPLGRGREPACKAS